VVCVPGVVVLLLQFQLPVGLTYVSFLSNFLDLILAADG
jgi:hypothetical protein